MATIRFATSLTQALSGKPEHVALFAPQKALAGVWKKAFTAKRAQDVVGAMVKKAEAGGLGRLVTTFTGTSPARASVAILPDTPSRHLSPSRSHAAAELAAKLDFNGAKKATVVLCLDDPAHYGAVANAVARAFPLYANRSKQAKAPALTLVAIDPKGKPIKASPEVKEIVEATRWAASLVDRPAAELSPADFVSEARKGLKGIRGVKVSAIVGAQLEKKGLGGIYGVGKGAAVPPRLLVLEAGPARAKRTVALVGKGVVYDTGGLNLKTGGHMYGMKCDMGGAAAMLGAFRVLAKTKPAGTKVVCLIPLAENAIGPDSYRPDDILTLHSGKTVEINNTDAEGRLLLADAVSYAGRTFKPHLIVDAATLTGAQLLATGKRHAAIVSNRAGVEAAGVAAGLASGDGTHPLPFAPEVFQLEFKSAVADMRNSVADRMNAQTSCAGQFVYSHIQDLDLAWLHIDLAGPAFPAKRATGFGVALVATLVNRLEAADLKA